MLVVRQQPVNARRQYRLHRDRHLQAFNGTSQAVRPAIADEDFGLNERANALLQEERIAFGPLDEELLERHECSVGTQEALEETLRTFGGERVDPQLCVVRPPAPAMLVLRPVIDKEQ